MSFKLVGDGSYTSSAAITTVNFTNVGVILPAPYRTEGNDLIHHTEANFVHGYKQGVTLRRWQIGLRLLTFAQWRTLQDAFEILGNRHWCMWEQYAATATSGTTTTIVESTTTAGTTDDWYNNMAAVITSAGSAAPEGEISRVSDYAETAGAGQWTVATAYTAAVAATDTASIGWPVRFVGTIDRFDMRPNLYGVDFTFEEVLFGGTD